jgi:hypothetical protein
MSALREAFTGFALWMLGCVVVAAVLLLLPWDFKSDGAQHYPKRTTSGSPCDAYGNCFDPGEDYASDEGDRYENAR